MQRAQIARLGAALSALEADLADLLATPLPDGEQQPPAVSVPFGELTGPCCIWQDLSKSYPRGEGLYTEDMLRCEWLQSLTLWCRLHAAMRTAMAEFPALDDADAHAEALQLLTACAAGSLEPWTAVLALLLGDSDTLAGVLLQIVQ